MQDNNRLMTRIEVEKRFGFTKRFLEVAATRGDGPTFVHIGRNVRYRPCDIGAGIQERGVASSS